ncbi:hypothetical protein AB1N83_011698 [Pleurotus pulmonarius]
MKEYYDEETQIETTYLYDLEGIMVQFNDSTLWLKVERSHYYRIWLDIDVRFCVEFANSEECTRFLHEDMRELEERYIYNTDSDVSVIGDIMRALSAIHDDHATAEEDAAWPGVTLAGRTMSIIFAHRALLGLVRLV